MQLRMAFPILLATGLMALSPNPTVREDADTIVIKMIDKSATEYIFEPAQVTAKPGDIIQFVQTTATPHNVEFRNVPAGAALNGQTSGPYLTQPDETYEITIDEKFAPGDYKIVCTPHEFLGMTGTITIAGDQ